MAELFAWEPYIDQRTLRARTMVVTVGSFIDAGNVQQLLTKHLQNVCQSSVLGRFDVDQLVDYREHRPMLTFDRDHFTDFQAPELLVRGMTDAHGERFVLLSGVEPALRWEAMVEQVERVIDALDVQLVVVLQGIPMMVPHTRPVAITKHATRPELIPGNQPVFGTVGLPASFPALLELRLGQRGHDVVGLTCHVPHYLAQTDFPDAALALLQGLQDTAGLHVPTTELAVAAGVVRAQLAEHLSENEEFAEVVDNLEHQYDQVVEQRAITIGEAELPTADEIGAEAEKFLAFQGPVDPGAGGTDRPRRRDDAAQDDGAGGGTGPDDGDLPPTP